MLGMLCKDLDDVLPVLKHFLYKFFTMLFDKLFQILLARFNFFDKFLAQFDQSLSIN